MSDDADAAFLSAIVAYVNEHPSVAPYVVEAARKGIERALNETLERAVDMEVALAMQLGKGKLNDLSRAKLEKWRGKSSLEWKWALERHTSQAGTVPSNAARPND